MIVRILLSLFVVFASLGCSDAQTSASDAASDPSVDSSGDPSVDPADIAVEVGDLTPEADASQPVDTCVGPSSAQVQNAWLPDGFCAWIWADDLSQPRGITVSDNGDVLVVERRRERVVVLFDDDQNSLSGPEERAVLASATGLNHGISIHDGYLYASSSSTVYRWPYSAGDRMALGPASTVIHSIPSGGHSTRTLTFDDQGRLYVTVGSAGNVDQNSNRSRIRRFTLPEELGGGIDFDSGDVFADGLRNEVGLGWDSDGRLWGVENGVDNLNRSNLGGDIHNNNPAEELNLFAEAGRFYGYPYCWSEFELPAGVGGGPSAQWAHPDFMADGTHDDSWCRSTDNVVPPALSMQAHSAPLDIHFYRGGSFPHDFDNDAFVTFHGSWNRDEPTGYKLVRVRFSSGQPEEVEPMLEYSGEGDIASAWRHRPVGVHTGADGRLFVTSDRSGVVIAVGYERP